MNQGRIWTVVQPTIGLPLFLGAVALTSLTVHAAVLNNTTWMKDFYAGSSKAKTAKAELSTSTAVAQAGSSFDVRVAKATGTDGAVTVTITPQAATSASAERTSIHSDKLALNTLQPR